MAFTPFMAAIAVVLPLGTLLAWKRGDLGRGLRQLAPALALAVALAAPIEPTRFGVFRM
jgi:cytochrome c-type biogenesis protein CcmF